MKQATRFTRLALSLVLIGALALAGCGGDDNNDVENDLRAQIEMLTAERDAAQTAQAAAEAAQADAESAAAAAMAAQTAAEMERDAANTAKGAAEAAQMAAEMAQADAEAAQMAAEAAQMTAEAAEMAAETAQTVAETERDAAVGALSAAEMARDAARDAEAAALVAQATAEAAQASAEADSADAMAAQMAAEAAQMAAEAAQAMAEAAQATAEAAQMAAEEAQAMAEAAQATAEMERDAANTAQMAAEAAQATAEMERDAANTARMAAETARDAALQAEMTAKQAQADAEEKARMYKAQLDALEGTVETGEMADANAAAKALFAVLSNNNVETRIPLGGSNTAFRTAPTAETAEDHNWTGLVGTTLVTTITDDGDADNGFEVNIERQRVANDVSNLMVEVSNDGMLTASVEDTPAYKMTETSPDAIDGMRGAMLTRGTVIKDTVVVYSDIGNDGTATLLDRYTSTLPTDDEPRMWTITALDAVGGDPTTDGLIPWSEVERPDSETAFAGTGDTAMLTFKGTVHDIPGTFSCTTGGAAGTGNACKTPARYSDGSVAVVATTDNTGDGPSFGDENGLGAWTFVPDDGVSLYTDDANYLMLGWWLLKDAAGRPADFLAFSTATGLGVQRSAANSVAADAAGALAVAGGEITAGTVGTEGTAIRGRATYSGAAVGKYATASTLEDEYKGGHFTADATLTANFDADMDGDTTTAADATTGVALSGVIDNFMTGDTARPDWAVSLMVDNDGSNATPALPTTALGAAGSRMLTRWSTGAAAVGTGGWSATWYGGVGIPDDAAAAEDLVKGAPDAAVGTFNAFIGSAARMQGAFAVNKDE